MQQSDAQAGVQQSSGRQLSTVELAAILDREIAPYVANGFVVTSRTESSAQLLKRKQFSNNGCMTAFLFFISGGLITLIQFFIYLSAKDQSVFISVDPMGNVSRT